VSVEIPSGDVQLVAEVDTNDLLADHKPFGWHDGLRELARQESCSLGTGVEGSRSGHGQVDSPARFLNARYPTLAHLRKVAQLLLSRVELDLVPQVVTVSLHQELVDGDILSIYALHQNSFT
jgi:hypothetical protein